VPSSGFGRSERTNPFDSFPASAPQENGTAMEAIFGVGSIGGTVVSELGIGFGRGNDCLKIDGIEYCLNMNTSEEQQIVHN
jgi:hypothetical protein